MNQGVIQTSLISQPQKLHLFYGTMNPTHPGWKKKHSTAKFDSRFEKTCYSLGLLSQQFGIGSLSIYEFKWNWPNLTYDEIYYTYYNMYYKI